MSAATISLDSVKPRAVSYDKMLKFHHTDAGNAELFAHLYRGSVLYDHKRGYWLVWKRHWWAQDQTSIVMELAKGVARAWAQAAFSIPLDQADEEDEKKRTRLLAWAMKCESRYRIKAIEEMARSVPALADSGENWDRDPWLLGVSNGVVDLRTGKLRPGKPDDRISMNTEVAFDPVAKCPRWEQFLKEIFGDDEQLIGGVHRAIGYSATGSPREQRTFFCHGTGWNGKNTLLEALLYVLGPYGVVVPFSTFEPKARGAIPHEIANTAGKRLIVASETDESTRLNTARIKAMTGDGRQSARFLHKNLFEFDTTGKVWLAFNFKPQITDDSLGMWRRILVVPFLVNFRDRGDKDLPDKLRAEAPGILAWIVRGCMDWQRRGLDAPDAMQCATREYRQESDQIGRFLADRCVLEPSAQVPATELWKTFERWVKETEEAETPIRKEFVRRLERKGLHREPKGEERTLTWVGVRVSESLTQIISPSKHCMEKNPERESPTLSPSLARDKDSASEVPDLSTFPAADDD